jgi:hypothetical protein
MILFRDRRGVFRRVRLDMLDGRGDYRRASADNIRPLRTGMPRSGAAGFSGRFRSKRGPCEGAACVPAFRVRNARIGAVFRRRRGKIGGFGRRDVRRGPWRAHGY